MKQLAYCRSVISFRVVHTVLKALGKSTAVSVDFNFQRVNKIELPPILPSAFLFEDPLKQMTMQCWDGWCVCVSVQKEERIGISACTITVWGFCQQI